MNELHVGGRMFGAAAVAKAVNAVALDVKSGRFDSAKAAAEAMRKQALEAMERSLNHSPPPGGKGGGKP